MKTKSAWTMEHEGFEGGRDDNLAGAQERGCLNLQRYARLDVCV